VPLNTTSKQHRILIAGIAALFFLPFLGGVHLFDWDEINFAEASREMLLSGDYARVYINFQPFWEKPPFFFWLQSAAMAMLGVGEYAARLPNALAGILTLLLLYQVGIRFRDARFGLLWAMAYFGSTLPFLYFKSGIIDPWFNLFIFLGLYHFILFYQQKEGITPGKTRYRLFLSGFFTGMAMLTKGPVGLLIVGLVLVVYWVYERFRMYISVGQALLFLGASLLVGATWLGLETWQNGPWFVQEFMAYQYRLFSTPDAGHKGFPGYHLVVLLLGCFPASVFAVRAFFRMPEEQSRGMADLRRWMKILFWVVVILFSIVESKIVHYSSMAYFPLSFLAALVMEQLLANRLSLVRPMKAGLMIIGGITALLSLLVPLLGMNTSLLKAMINDPFGKANLDAAVHWTYWDFTPGIFMLLVLWFYFMHQRKLAILFFGNAIFVMLGLIFFIGNIESYSQRAAIDFFKEKAVEDCYIVTHGYKSYAHLFYARKRPVTDERSYDKAWLLSGDVDKQVYVVCKIHRVWELSAFPQLEETGRKNGFVFFKRIP
jgi:4-amino-4-deoxy-L-arabinose transferase-like glycosyltransferase